MTNDTRKITRDTRKITRELRGKKGFDRKTRWNAADVIERQEEEILNLQEECYRLNSFRDSMKMFAKCEYSKIVAMQSDDFLKQLDLGLANEIAFKLVRNGTFDFETIPTEDPFVAERICTITVVKPSAIEGDIKMGQDIFKNYRKMMRKEQ